MDGMEEHATTPGMIQGEGCDRWWLALDSGQTATKARVLLSEGQAQDFTLPGVQTHRPLPPQLRDLILSGIATAKELGATDEAETVAVGTSGLTAQEAEAAPLLRLLGDAPVKELRLAHDSVTGYLGALGEGRGAVVAAGTGVVTLAVGERKTARVDGWGSIMGDAGSGYWFGQAGMEAAMRAYDGRGPATGLQEVVRGHWPDLEGAYIELQNDSDTVGLVASFSKDIADLAESGDEVALKICLRGAAELAHSVRTALRRTGQDGAESAPQIAAIGGVFRSAIVRDEFRRLLVEAVPGARETERPGAGVDGATSLLQLGGGNPLHSRVSTARR